MITPPKRLRSNVNRGSGRNLDVSADPMTLTRLSYCQHAIADVLGMNVSSSVLIRRALRVYVDTLTPLIKTRELAASVPEFCLGDGLDRKAVKASHEHQQERNGLNNAIRGETSMLTKAHFELKPIKPLSELITEHRPQTSDVMEMIRSDLARWAALNNETKKATDDH